MKLGFRIPRAKICRNPVTRKQCFQELSYDADEAIPGADEFQVIYTLDISILVLKVLCFFRSMEWVNPR